MEDDFYATIKLLSGEEIFAKVSASDEDDRTLLLISDPVIVEEVKLPHNGMAIGYKVEPWLKTTEDTLCIIDMKNVLTMTENNNEDMITMHCRFVMEQELDKLPSHRHDIGREMGYISTVDDAKEMLEKIFDLEQEEF